MAAPARRRSGGWRWPAARWRLPDHRPPAADRPIRCGRARGPPGVRRPWCSGRRPRVRPTGRPGCHPPGAMRWPAPAPRGPIPAPIRSGCAGPARPARPVPCRHHRPRPAAGPACAGGAAAPGQARLPPGGTALRRGRARARSRPAGGWAAGCRCSGSRRRWCLHWAAATARHGAPPRCGRWRWPPRCGPCRSAPGRGTTGR